MHDTTTLQAAGMRLEFDRQGVLTSSTTCARAPGTTVAVADLFTPLPVRRQVRSLHASLYLSSPVLACLPACLTTHLGL